MKRVVVLGAGFAGLWSAIGAARQRLALGIDASALEIAVVNRDAFHSIRVRNYETDLSGAQIALDPLFETAGIRGVVAEVTGIDAGERRVTTHSAGGKTQAIGYDRLVFALGSELIQPAIAGWAEHAFNVDTHAGAVRLNAHLARRFEGSNTAAAQAVVVVAGGGLTGIETATEMRDKLRRLGAPAARIVIVDRQPRIGAGLGADAQAVVETAFSDLGIEQRCGLSVAAVDAAGVSLSDGERFSAAMLVWCGGTRASRWTLAFGVALDAMGRLPVDSALQVVGAPGVFAAGDAAALCVDGEHSSLMTCQHGRPMGRFAGHNVVCDLAGEPLKPLHIPWVVRVVDLGPWGAVCTEGWQARVALQGAAAKRVKQIINHVRIVPPQDGDRDRLLAAAEAAVDAPPNFGA